MGMCVVFHNYFGKRDTGVSWKTRRHNLVLGGCVKDAFLFFKKGWRYRFRKGKDVCYIAYDSCPLCLLIREIIL